ncbi:DUF221-domain-containing protein [Wilcoxina mikolae CBS 423.85]|nr:DUF221-domain-containing protein [Wilcoxina mikolae CBS 423.85]
MSASSRPTAARSSGDALSSAISTALSSAVSSFSDVASSTASTTTSRPTPSVTSVNRIINQNQGSAQSQSGVSLPTFLASLSVAATVFGVEVLLFVLLRKKMKRVYEPRTYLVPEKRRTPSPTAGFLNFFAPVFETATSDFISKSGLDAYFFLRYLLMLLKIFIVIALAIIPILIPINYIGGKGGRDVQGLDRLAWSNVAPKNTQRYWAHLFLALMLIVVFCYMFYDEMRKYIRMRQAYLTSPQHRLRASATTVLVSAIPKSWLTIQRLLELYDVFPGGIRNVWINRDYDDLQEKVEERDKLARTLEKAETELILMCKKKHMKELAKAAKKDPQAAADQERSKQNADLGAGPGIASGNPHQIPQQLREHNDADGQRKKTTFGLEAMNTIPVVGGVVSNVGRGVRGGVSAVTGGVKKLAGGFDRHISESEGPTSRPTPSERQDSGGSRKRGSTLMGPDGSPIVAERNINYDDAALKATTSASSTVLSKDGGHMHKRPFWNRKNSDGNRYSEDDEVPLSHRTPTTPKNNHTFADAIGGIGGIFKPKAKEDYPPAYDKAFDGDNWGGEPVWKKYITEKQRPTMRLPLLSWLPSLPLIGKSVDTIYYCRREVARLNLEIEIDQETPERYPLMNSAFIQFNQQVAAHMACQALSHHVPQHMSPRHIEVSPNDVVWGNMKMQWWERYIRSSLITVATGGLIIGWAFPVAFVGLISQVNYLTDTFKWLAWLGRLPDFVLGLISGVLPPLLLGILMALLPMILRLFARIQGCHTGMAIEQSVQGMYFAFLFIQVFLVVSISSGITTVVKDISEQPFAAPEILARNLPKASNFFFSYLLLQAFSVSGAALLQIATLAVKFIIAPLLDTTARDKFTRATSLVEIKWGTFFPVYTNLACIGIVYSVISPLILLFNIITFSLFWIVYRYNLLFVVNFRFDTGGLLFPRAINQLFTGLYVMEACLIGLFFLVRDSQNRVACAPQGIVMIVATALTVMFHITLNRAFGPLLTYLPITLEDDAVIRDQEFAREQDERRRKNILGREEVPGENLNDALARRERAEEGGDSSSGGIEMKRISNEKSAPDPEAGQHRGDPPALALFQDIADDIEDLTPEERDQLVARAFQHPAIRAKRPVIWIPRDDLGVSDDEIRRTMKFSDKVWISNEYASVDRKGKVQYARSPPDFDMRDLVEL